MSILYAYFQASSSDVSQLLVCVSESSNSALQVLLQGENRLELWFCKKPFFPKSFLLSCSVFLWNSLSSSSVRERQFSSFSEDSCHPIAFSNLCSASREWERTSPILFYGESKTILMTAFPSIFLWLRCAVVLQTFWLVTGSALWEVSIRVILWGFRTTLPVSSSAGQLGQTRGADLSWSSDASRALFGRT